MNDSIMNGTISGDTTFYVENLHVNLRQRSRRIVTLRSDLQVALIITGIPRSSFVNVNLDEAYSILLLTLAVSGILTYSMIKIIKKNSYHFKSLV